jgi:hypothetical protein
VRYKKYLLSLVLLFSIHSIFADSASADLLLPWVSKDTAYPATIISYTDPHFAKALRADLFSLANTLKHAASFSSVSLMPGKFFLTGSVLELTPVLVKLLPSSLFFTHLGAGFKQKLGDFSFSASLQGLFTSKIIQDIEGIQLSVHEASFPALNIEVARKDSGLRVWGTTGAIRMDLGSVHIGDASARAFFTSLFWKDLSVFYLNVDGSLDASVYAWITQTQGIEAIVTANLDIQAFGALYSYHKKFKKVDVGFVLAAALLLSCDTFLDAQYTQDTEQTDWEYSLLAHPAFVGLADIQLGFSCASWCRIVIARTLAYQAGLSVVDAVVGQAVFSENSVDAFDIYSIIFAGLRISAKIQF